MSDYDTYLDRVRAHVNARKPLTRAEKQIIGVYLGMVAIAFIVAFAIR
jgi:hypothetical protein